MSTTVVQARVETSLKKEVEQVLAGLELDLPEAIRLFFRQVVNRGTLPFTLAQKQDPFYSEENLRAIDEAVAGYRRGEFVDFNDLKASL